MRVAVLVLLAACSGAQPAATPARDSGERLDGRAPDGPAVSRDAPLAAPHLVLRGATVAGVGPADVEIRDGRIVAVGVVPPGRGRDVDLRGRFLAPAAIDAHVHLAFLPVAEQLAAGGVAAAVDLAAPLDFLAAPPEALRVIAAGPMITARGGYPTRSWGAAGYGLEVEGAGEARAAVDRLIAAGARVIKVPLNPPALADAELEAIVTRAHEHGVLVAAHALADAEARRAADAGCDLLAHTPVEPLADATVAAWRGRAVISTLTAFGPAASTVDNLRRLRAAGVTVLYGTDLGNTRTAGIDAAEIRALATAGLEPRAIVEALTDAPARTFALDADLGAIAAGREASLLVLSADPLADPAVLAEPDEVYLRGIRR